jgi:hypothetical protein
MAPWTNDELNKIGAAEELEIATLKSNGALRRPVTIWVVRQGNDLYIRPIHGRTSSWFRAAQERHEAHIRADGVEKDVRLVETDDLNDEIDAAYRRKYGHYSASVVGTVVSPQARAATLKLVPRTSS